MDPASSFLCTEPVAVDEVALLARGGEHQMGMGFKSGSALTVRRTASPSILGILRSRSTTAGGAGSRPANRRTNKGSTRRR